MSKLVFFVESPLNSYEGQFRARYNFEKYHYGEDYIDDIDHTLVSLLKERFPSFKMHSFVPLIFDIVNNEDRDHFLVWSSDGVEI